MIVEEEESAAIECNRSDTVRSPTPTKLARSLFTSRQSEANGCAGRCSTCTTKSSFTFLMSKQGTLRAACKSLSVLITVWISLRKKSECSTSSASKRPQSFISASMDHDLNGCSLFIKTSASRTTIRSKLGLSKRSRRFLAAP